MKSVVCWLWNEGFRDYRPEYVNVLHRMFQRHLPEPHRFICVTDERGQYDSGIEVMPTPEAARRIASIRTPEGGRFPSCYRRLWMFSPEAVCLGDRVMLVDIDVVLTGDVTHLFDVDADFVGWKPRATWGNNQRIGGGLYVMTPGTQSHVWEDFRGDASIREARRFGYRGSDQAWMSYKLRGCSLLPYDCGVYSIRDLDNGRKPLPSDACIVQFNGRTKPWHSALAWVRKHWC